MSLSTPKAVTFRFLDYVATARHRQRIDHESERSWFAFVTSTDGTNSMIVWIVRADDGGDQRLHGFDGEAGAVVLPAADRRVNGRHVLFDAGIAARGGYLYLPTEQQDIPLPRREEWLTP